MSNYESVTLLHGTAHPIHYLLIILVHCVLFEFYTTHTHLAIDSTCERAHPTQHAAATDIVKSQHNQPRRRAYDKSILNWHVTSLMHVLQNAIKSVQHSAGRQSQRQEQSGRWHSRREKSQQSVHLSMQLKSGSQQGANAAHSQRQQSGCVAQNLALGAQQHGGASGSQ